MALVGSLQISVTRTEVDADRAEPAEDIELAVDVGDDGLQPGLNTGEVGLQNLFRTRGLAPLQLPQQDANESRVFFRHHGSSGPALSADIRRRQNPEQECQKNGTSNLQRSIRKSSHVLALNGSSGRDLALCGRACPYKLETAAGGDDGASGNSGFETQSSRVCREDTGNQPPILPDERHG